MPQRSPSERHRRTRQDHATETAEDYVEAVDDILREQSECRIVDLSRRFAVSHVTVTRVVARLVQEGYLLTEPYRPVRLTPKGKRLAERSRQRHEIVYLFLLALGVEPAIAALDAEGIEHHVSRQTLDAMRQFTASRQADPPDG